MKMETHPDADKMVMHLQRMLYGRLHSCRTVVVRGSGFVVHEDCKPLDVMAAVTLPEGTDTLPGQDLATEEDARRMRLFNDAAPCWFPGCQEMRARYAQDLDRLPPECPACEIGNIMRRYLREMAALGV